MAFKFLDVSDRRGLRDEQPDRAGRLRVSVQVPIGACVEQNILWIPGGVFCETSDC